MGFDFIISSFSIIVFIPVFHDSFILYTHLINQNIFRLIFHVIDTTRFHLRPFTASTNSECSREYFWWLFFPFSLLFFHHKCYTFLKAIYISSDIFLFYNPTPNTSLGNNNSATRETLGVILWFKTQSLPNPFVLNTKQTIYYLFRKVTNSI